MLSLSVYRPSRETTKFHSHRGPLLQPRNKIAWKLKPSGTSKDVHYGKIKKKDMRVADNHYTISHLHFNFLLVFFLQTVIDDYIEPVSATVLFRRATVCCVEEKVHRSAGMMNGSANNYSWEACARNGPLYLTPPSMPLPNSPSNAGCWVNVVWMQRMSATLDSETPHCINVAGATLP